MKLLGVSGSLRIASTNTRLLRAAETLVPPGAELRVTELVGSLPLFTPDVGEGEVPGVEAWTDEVRAARGLVVSTPEYAGGYPGALKNAFDWLVRTDAFVNKPFMLLGASTRSTLARDTFTRVLETMSGVHVREASTTIPLLGTALEVADILENEGFAGEIRRALGAFVTRLKELDAPVPSEVRDRVL